MLPMSRTAPCLVPLIAAAMAMSACTKASKPPPAKPRVPALVATIDLPGDDGRVHVVDVPASSGIESSRCVVAVSRVGAVSTSCPPKDIDLPPLDE